MKRNCIIVVSIVCWLLFFYPEAANAQDTVQRIELKVAPFFFDYTRFDPFEDLDSAGLTIIIKESALLHFSNDRFYSVLRSSEKKIINDDIATDYRVKCTIFLFYGKSEVLYMNRFGEFLYTDKKYKNERVKEFVFEHIPDAYKDAE